MQIGQLVVPDIFAVLVNFTLAAQQIAKITTLYTSPSVARLPRLLPLLIRAPVIARQVPALSVHVLDPSSVEKVEREESLSICLKREREREKDPIAPTRRELEGEEGKGGRNQYRNVLRSAESSPGNAIQYLLQLPLLRSAPPSRRSIGFPSLLPPHPSGAPVHLHLLHSPLDSLRWTFLNHERPNEKKKEKRRRRRWWWWLSLPFFFSSTESFSSQIYIFSIFPLCSFFSSIFIFFFFLYKKKYKKKR